MHLRTNERDHVNKKRKQYFNFFGKFETAELVKAIWIRCIKHIHSLKIIKVLFRLPGMEKCQFLQLIPFLVTTLQIVWKIIIYEAGGVHSPGIPSYHSAVCVCVRARACVHVYRS